MPFTSPKVSVNIHIIIYNIDIRYLYIYLCVSYVFWNKGEKSETTITNAGCISIRHWTKNKRNYDSIMIQVDPRISFLSQGRGRRAVLVIWYTHPPLQFFVCYEKANVGMWRQTMTPSTGDIQLVILQKFGRKNINRSACPKMKWW